MANKIFSFPKQKLSYKEKTEEWHIENVKAGVLLSDYNPSKSRKTKQEMTLNYDLVSGKFDEKDIDRSLNPKSFKGINFPAKIQNYPIELTKLDVLKGEEISRPFNWYLRAVNDHVIIEKEEKEQKELQEYIVRELKNPDYSELQAKNNLQKLKKYYVYDYQDKREEMGTRLLQYLWRTQKIPTLTTDAFYDIVTVAEEQYACDIFHGEPKNRKVRPRSLSAFGLGESNYIEDAMIIVEDSYMSVGSVIDMFFDYLTDDQVKILDEGKLNKTIGQNIMFSGPISLNDEYVLQYGTQLLPVSSSDVLSYGGGFDDEGNVRVTRVCWKSKVKVGELTYYEDGEELKDYVSEDYVIDKLKGEKVKWLWLNEWRQGYNIGGVGDGFFVKLEMLPRLGMTYNNPSRVMPPYIGTIYKIGEKAYSLVDRIRPYKYLYNITMTRAEMASARNKGNLTELDLARIPDGWDPDIWMMYAEANGWFLTDSFKEGNEGAALGKLLNNINNRSPVTLNLDASQQIMTQLEFARYIKNEINEITGITPQREGMISNRETLGGVNRSLQQSSFITEPYFHIHDNTKLRLLELNLETAKYCFRDQSFSLNILDDGLIKNTLKIDGKLLSETVYGMYMSDGKDDAELFNYIKQYAHAALQNDTGKFKDIFEIMKSKSIAAVGKRMEEAEQERIMEKDLDMEKQQQAQMSINEANIKWEQMKFNQQMQIDMRKLQNEIELKILDIEAIKYNTDAKSEIEIERLRVEIQISKDKLRATLEKMRQDNEEFNRKLSQERELFNKDLAMRRQKVPA
jgi:hypothetical protein